jgi:predicted secreted protein
MAAINGTLILFNVDVDGGTPATLGATTSATLNIDMDLPDASSKDSAGWADHIQGQKSWSIDVDGIANFISSTGNVEELGNYILNRNTVDVEFVPNDAAGDLPSGTYVKYTGEASCASVSFVAGNEDTATLSGSFTGKGALTASTVTKA